MPRMPSTMLALGTKAPAFNLHEPLTGKTIRLSDYDGQPLLILFTCNHCPFVINLRESLTGFVKRNQEQGLAVIAINSNDVERFQDDSPEKMIEEVRNNGFTFPYLFDEDQKVAMAYEAACTPGFLLI